MNLPKFNYLYCKVSVRGLKEQLQYGPTRLSGFPISLLYFFKFLILYLTFNNDIVMPRG